jgi:hypothetical protein
MAVALKTAKFFPSISALWLKSSVVQTIVACTALWFLPLGLISATVVWTGAVILFLWMAHYDWSECRNLAEMFMPGSRAIAQDDSDALFSEPAAEAAHSRAASY